MRIFVHYVFIITYFSFIMCAWGNKAAAFKSASNAGSSILL